MDDLVTWLRVQIDEDERTANSNDDWRLLDGGDPYFSEVARAGGMVGRFGKAEAEHIARWDPRRVQAECETKRKIIERYLFVTGHGPAVDHTRAMDMTTGASSALGDVLRFLTLPYVNRPGYREEWRP